MSADAGTWSLRGQLAVGSRELCPAPAALLPRPVSQINVFGLTESAGKSVNEYPTTQSFFPSDDEAK